MVLTYNDKSLLYHFIERMVYGECPYQLYLMEHLLQFILFEMYFTGGVPEFVKSINDQPKGQIRISDETEITLRHYWYRYERDKDITFFIAFLKQHGFY